MMTLKNLDELEENYAGSENYAVVIPNVLNLSNVTGMEIATELLK